MIPNAVLYLRRNFGRTSLFAGIVAVAVAGSIAVSAIFGSFGDTRQKMVHPTKRMVEISSLSPIDARAISDLANVKVYPLTRLSIGYPMLGAAIAGMPVYGFPEHVVDQAMSLLGIRLSSGRLPTAEGQVALPESLLKATGLNVGDIWVEKDPHLSNGAFPIVGSLVGEALIGLTALSGSDLKEPRRVIAFTEDPSRLEAFLNESLGRGFSIRGPLVAQESFRSAYSTYIAISGGITVAFAALTAFIIGLTAAEEGRQRRTEYVLLSIVGFDRRTLYFRSLKEVAVKSLIGWLSGVILGFATVAAASLTLFEPKGLIVELGPDRLAPTLIVPLISGLVNLRSLRKSFSGDPVTMLDAFGAVREAG